MREGEGCSSRVYCALTMRRRGEGGEGCCTRVYCALTMKKRGEGRGRL